MTASLVEAALAPRNERVREICLWVLLGALGLFVYAARFFCTAWDFVAEQPGAGQAGTALLDGLAAPIWYYQNATATCSVFFGMLLYPFYAVFGSSFLVLKLVSAAMVVGGAVFWTLALRRAWGLTAAAIFFLCLVFPPPFLDWHFHQSWGGRSESLLFSGLLVYLFVRLGDAPPSFLASLILGLIAGFASFFCFENLAVAAALALATIWRWGRAGLHRLLWPAAFGFAGTMSLTFFAVALPPAVADPTQYARAGLAAAVWRGWLDLFGRWLPTFAGYRGAAGRWLSAGWSALAAPGLLVAAWCGVREQARPSAKSALAVFAVGHVFCFAAAYGLSPQKIPLRSVNGPFFEMRYLYTLAPTLLALSAFFLMRLRGGWKWLLLLPFLAGGFANVRTGGAFTLRDFTGGAAAIDARRGDNYYVWIRSGLSDSWRDTPHALASVAKLPRRWRAVGRRQLGRWLRPLSGLELLSDNRQLSPDARREIAIGVGSRLVDDLAKHARQVGLVAEPANVFTLLRKLDRDSATGIAIGLGLVMAAAPEPANNEFFAGFVPFVCSALRQLNDRECRLAAVYGDGARRLAAIPPTDPSAIAQTISRCGLAAAGVGPAEALAAFRQGYAETLAFELASTYRRVGIAGDLEPELREAFARMGISLRPTDKTHDYDLEILP